ncbi:MAG: DUF4405 domain-containing protein [Nitrospiraceae bacterium]|nr:MAG: DUF4405 domain-containing protein [Nitrospiraceae bacterium]
MDRPGKNFLVDVLSFTGFVLLTSTGVLMRYILPPGSGRWKAIWGLDRHEWGSIHFWISVLFLGVLTVHLILHWRWVVTFIARKPREGSGLRAGLGIIGLAGLAALAIAPLVSPVTTIGAGDRGVSLSEGHGDIHLEGSMTVREVEQSTGVPAEIIIVELGVPTDTDRDERLGRLRKRYGFTMEDVQRIIRHYRKEE